jgi:hypothetical protein
MIFTQASHQQLKEALECFVTIEEQTYLFPVLLSWAKDTEQAIFWFHNEPIPAFGNTTALSICERGHSKELIEYIKALEMGGYA